MALRVWVVGYGIQCALHMACMCVEYRRRWRRRRGTRHRLSASSSSSEDSGPGLTNSTQQLVGYEGLEVINPEGSTEDAEEEASRGRWKQEDRDCYWKMMQKYIGSDVTLMVTLPVIIFEPMTMLQKLAELMEYSYLLDMADKTEDPYMRMVFVHVGSVGVTRPERPGLDLSKQPPAVRLNKELDFSLTYKLKGEDLIRESGIPYAIIRPCALTEEPAGAELIFDQGENITGKK